MCRKEGFAGLVSLVIVLCLCSIGFGQEVYFFDMSPPYVWSIQPDNPTTQDVIHIRGPFDNPSFYYMNDCYAMHAAGCWPELQITSSAIYLGCGGPLPPSGYCYQVLIPVNAVECVFGPLPAGNKTFIAMYPLAHGSINFTVREPLTVLSPNGGEEWVVDSNQQIIWQSYGVINEVLIEYSTDNGVNWQIVAPNAPNTGSYQWTIPDANSQQCLVRVSKVGDPSVYDFSDDVFTIFPCDRDLPMDFNSDCYVDFADFAIFSAGWLDCGNPYDPDCW
ncbi:MAG: hypothetical protein ABII09_08015 [Planctomycetota bacterium]